MATALPVAEAPALPELLALPDATARLAAFVGSWRDHVLDRVADTSIAPLTFVARATVGLGKTRSLIDTLPPLLAAIDPKAAIAVAEPTLKKCDELRRDLIAAGVGTSREIIVLRGRDAADPSVMPDEFGVQPSMCVRSKTVKQVAGLVDNVSRRMCRSTWTDENGDEQVQECPFFVSCSHVRQGRAAMQARILIVTHAALHVGQSELSEERGRLAALIIDEDATRALVTHTDLPLANVFAVPADPYSEWPCREPNLETPCPGLAETPSDPRELATILKTRYLLNLDAIKSVIEATKADTRRAEIKPSLIAAALAEAHQWEVGTKENLAERAHRELSFMAVFERRKDDLRGIAPTTADAIVLELVQLNRLHDRFRLATFWTRLRDQVDVWATTEDPRRDYCRSIVMDWKAITRTEDGDPVSVPTLRLHYSKDLKGGVGRVPTLILDADADELLLSRWVRIDRFERIDAQYSKTRIRQAITRTGSMASMKKQTTIHEIVGAANFLAMKHRGHIAETVRTVTNDQGATVYETPRAVAIFSIKDAVSQMRETFTANDEAERRAAALDASIDPRFVTVGHYGELRGMNNWQHCAGAVIAGRVELSVDGLEDQARAIWHLDATPFDYIETVARNAARRLATVPGWYRVKGRAQPVQAPRTGHPDARIDAVLVAIREAELRQALGRIRPVQRPGGDTLPDCDVIVLTNVPLGLDVEIDSLHDWSDLAGDGIDRVWTAGVIPDNTRDLATLAGMTTNALSTAMHRRRAKRDIQAPAPGRRLSSDQARSAYADALGRPGELDIGDRRMLRVSYTVEEDDGELVTRRATVMVARGETRRDAYERAVEIIARLDAMVMIEGLEEGEAGFEAQLEDDVMAWWLHLVEVPPTPGREGHLLPYSLRN